MADPSSLWARHWLEAEGDLSLWRTTVEAQIEIAHGAVAQFISPPRLDILIQRACGRVIPQIGMGGHAYGKSCLCLRVDPDNENFARALDQGAVQRIIVHEAHHCMRMAGPGYGSTLGEALVTEGLAGRFTQIVLGSPAELWERAVDPEKLRALLPNDEELSSKHYKHGDWFHGKGKYPRWLGYALGYALVGEWIALAKPTGLALINTPAPEILKLALPRLSK